MQTLLVIIVLKEGCLHADFRQFVFYVFPLGSIDTKYITCYIKKNKTLPWNVFLNEYLSSGRTTENTVGGHEMPSLDYRWLYFPRWFIRTKLVAKNFDYLGSLFLVSLWTNWLLVDMMN